MDRFEHPPPGLVQENKRSETPVFVINKIVFRTIATRISEKQQKSKSGFHSVFLHDIKAIHRTEKIWNLHFFYEFHIFS